jgi:hypothetical protein
MHGGFACASCGHVVNLHVQSGGCSSQHSAIVQLCDFNGVPGSFPGIVQGHLLVCVLNGSGPRFREPLSLH